jgi:hypothetical protein
MNTIKLTHVDDYSTKAGNGDIITTVYDIFVNKDAITMFGRTRKFYFKVDESKSMLAKDNYYEIIATRITLSNTASIWVKETSEEILELLK